MITKDYIEQALRTERRPSPCTEFGAEGEWLDGPDFRVLHAALGISTEAGELLDAVKKQIIYGKPLDVVNVAEEVGDLFWYLAILVDTLNLDPESIMETNIAKLRARYPEKYTDRDALNRDLPKEREVLETLEGGKMPCPSPSLNPNPESLLQEKQWLEPQ